MSDAQYALGIDLGTTHCALCEIDLDLSEGDEVASSMLAVPQLVAPGNVDARPLLPSFVYLPHPQELPEGSLRLPWTGQESPDHVVGEAARALGEKSALRLVSSAKSWLCHPDVDRRAGILPQGAPDEVPKISPLDASARYLAHLRQAYEAHNPGALAGQPVTITIPASFDPVARELTAEAARLAGLPEAVLLEEPQAALYAWLSGTRGAWREQLRVGDVILVVDVGGGTTDFSLIAVREEEGALALDRLAVGEHILLGGDNMDLALAYQVQQRLAAEGKQVDPSQMSTLTQACRAAKERLLGHAEEQSAPIVLAGKGASLIGGSLRTELRRDDVQALLLDGFFPEVGVDERPQVRARTGLRSLGLPYAQDAAITRHLAAFLGKQADALGGGHGGSPTAILFNGGVFKADALRQRMLGVVNRWRESQGEGPVRELPGADLDLAVARGAAYYGYVRQGGGIRIRGGSAMAYYVGMETAMPAVPGMPPPLQAVCVAPFGMEEGSRAEAPALQLGLVVGEPVRFPFFGSSVRRDDVAGQVLERWTGEELFALNDIEVTLPADEGQAPGQVVTVTLAAQLTETGTLVLEAVAVEGGARWRVELETRDSRDER